MFKYSQTVQMKWITLAGREGGRRGGKKGEKERGEDKKEKKGKKLILGVKLKSFT